MWNWPPYDVCGQKLKKYLKRAKKEKRKEARISKFKIEFLILFNRQCGFASKSKNEFL